MLAHDVLIYFILSIDKTNQNIYTYVHGDGDIILNRSNNFMFLRLKIYWNRQAFDLIRTSGI